jgi:DNA-binding MarR family transcriptional regulator
MTTAKVPEDRFPRLDEQLCFAIYQAGHAFNRMYRTVLADLGLTYPQYLVMLVLWQEDDRTVKAIGEKLFLDSGTLTPLLKRIEAAGLVSRRRDAEDERQVRVTLTDRGRALRAEAGDVPEAIFCALDRNGPLVDELKTDLTLLRDLLMRHTSA